MDISFHPAQIWATIGIVLIIADLFTLTFFLFFLGIGALVTSLSVWLGLTPGINSQLICFALASLVSMVLFRSTLKRMFGKSKGGAEYSEIVGQKASVTKAIPPGGEGKVTYRGSEWIAFSESTDEIGEGTLVVIVGVEGIKLKVSP